MRFESELWVEKALRFPLSVVLPNKTKKKKLIRKKPSTVMKSKEVEVKTLL